MKLPIITINEQIYKYKNGSKVFALYFGFEHEELLRKDYALAVKNRIANLIADSFATEQAVAFPYHQLNCVIFRSNIDKRILFQLVESILGELDAYTNGKLGIYYGFLKCLIVEKGKAPGPFHFAFTSDELATSKSLADSKKMLEYKERRIMYYLADMQNVKWNADE